MSTRLLALLPFSPTALILLRDSLVSHASTLFSASLPFSTLTHFHVQLSYLVLTSDWESFLSHTQIALNPKSNLRSLLRTA